MSYLVKIIKPDKLNIVMQDENLKIAAWLTYLVVRKLGGPKALEKQFSEYVEMKARGFA